MRTLISLALFWSWGLSAQERGYLESEILRQEGALSLSAHFLPHVAGRVLPPQMLMHGSLSPDAPDLLRDVDSRDEARIQRRIQESFGRPSLAQAKVALLPSWHRWQWGLMVNEAVLGAVNDPVFPEFQYFHVQSVQGQFAVQGEVYLGPILISPFYAHRSQDDFGLKKIEIYGLDLSLDFARWEGPSRSKTLETGISKGF